MEYIALFFTHSGAMKYKRFLSSHNIQCELMPVPRKLSSNCGIGAKFSVDDYENYITSDIEKVYEIKDEQYNLLYDDE